MKAMKALFIFSVIFMASCASCPSCLTEYQEQNAQYYGYSILPVHEIDSEINTSSVCFAEDGLTGRESCKHKLYMDEDGFWVIDRVCKCRQSRVIVADAYFSNTYAY